MQNATEVLTTEVTTTEILTTAAVEEITTTTLQPRILETVTNVSYVRIWLVITLGLRFDVYLFYFKN